MSRTNRARRSRHHRRLLEDPFFRSSHQQLEHLEQRRLLSASPLTADSPDEPPVDPAWFAAVAEPAETTRMATRFLDHARGNQQASAQVDLSRWIVKLSDELVAQYPTPAAANELFAPSEMEVLSGLGLPGQLLVGAHCTTTGQALEFFANEPGILYYEADTIQTGTLTPPDTLFEQQLGLHNNGNADINAPEAWDVSTGSSDVVVAIIDSGIDLDHDDLDGNLWVNPGEIPDNGKDDDGNGKRDDIHGWDFRSGDAVPNDENQHGTHVAGIIAAEQNGQGIVGVAWDASLMILKYLGPDNRGVTSDAVEAINYATLMRTRAENPVNVRVINNSYLTVRSAALEDAVAASAAADILFVVTAGIGTLLPGSGFDLDTQPVYPASIDSSLSIVVGASNPSDELAPFSNYGAETVDLLAPGVGIISTVPNFTGSNYKNLNGTSMAAPMVSGTAALLAAHLPDITASEIKAAILGSVHHLKALQGKVATGGRLDAFAALTIDTYRPRVTLVSSNLVSNLGEDKYPVKIQVRDNVAVDLATLDNNDLQLVGPTGQQLNTVIERDSTSGESDNEKTVTYLVHPPAGGWSSSFNDTYTLMVVAGQIGDTANPAGNTSLAQELGPFTVNISLAGPMTVNSTDDLPDIDLADNISHAGDGKATLRSAIMQANQTGGLDTVTVPAGTYTLTRSGADEDLADTGDLDITDSLTLEGAGTNTTIIDANGLDRVFDLRSGDNVVTLTLRNMTIQGGNVSGDGGGILANGNLVLENVVVTGNSASGDGAGIRASNQLQVTGSSISGNTAGGDGAGIRFSGEATGNFINDSLLANNTATGNGGGLYSDAQAIGALYATNLTVSGNQAATGGGLWAFSSSAQRLILANVTVTNNTASAAGGGVTGIVAPSTMRAINSDNSIIAGNHSTTGHANVDVDGRLDSSGGHNIIGIAGTATLTGITNGNNGNLVGTSAAPVDPGLTPLGDYGGPTLVHSLLPDSKAIDAGFGPSSTLPSYDHDQRGLPRPLDGDNNGSVHFDIGAMEFKLLGEISGIKFHDRNQDGHQDPGEEGLAGWTIFLDTNDNGALDAGELQTTTAADGSYSFVGLMPGDYEVAEVMQPNWVQTLPEASDPDYLAIPSLKVSNNISSEGALPSDARYTFQVTLSHPSSEPVSVDWEADTSTLNPFSLIPRNPSSPQEEHEYNGTLTLQPGETSAPLTLVGRGGTKFAEETQYFKLNLFNPQNAILANSQATSYLVDDDFTFSVNSELDTVDATPGDGTAADSEGRTTLRAAIMEANALAGFQSIHVPAGNYILTRAGADEDSAASGDLDIYGSDLSIVGADQDLTTIDGDGGDRVFDVHPGADLDLSRLNVTGGSLDQVYYSFPGQDHVVHSDRSITDIHASDIDADGDMDLVVADWKHSHKIAWYKNDGNQNFSRLEIASPGIPYSVFTADVDRDGDLDILSTSWMSDEIAWYENNGATDPSFTTHVITEGADGAHAVYAADVDGDGDMDILSASDTDDTIAWYENDGNQTFSTHVITNVADGARAVYAADIDGDGDMDVLSASGGDDTIAWYKNDGNQTFSTHVITNVADGAIDVHTADVDGDGDMDVLSASFSDNKIAWHENDGAANPSFSTHDITPGVTGPFSLDANDLDADGDIDILSTSLTDGTITWHENNGASDPGFTNHVIATDVTNATSVFSADVDGDGDLDVLSSGQGSTDIAWHENVKTGDPGGGIRLSGGDHNLVQVTISGNEASDNGAGIAAMNSATVNLVRSRVQNNESASAGGGLSVDNTSQVNLLDSRIDQNSAGTTSPGGGIFSEGTLTVTGSVIQENSAQQGGGIYAANEAVIKTSLVAGNEATTSDGQGGGLYLAGTASEPGNFLVSGSSIFENTSRGDGGGVYVSGTTVIDNTTIARNAALADGGGIVVSLPDGITTTVTASTITENTSGGAGGGLVRVGTTGTLSVTNTIIAGNTAIANFPDAKGAVFSLGHNLLGILDPATDAWDSAEGDLVGTPSVPVDARFDQLSQFRDWFASSDVQCQLHDVYEMVDTWWDTMPIPCWDGSYQPPFSATQWPLAANSPAVDTGDNASAGELDATGGARIVTVVAPFVATHVITTNTDDAADVYAADVNGDGHMDVLSASFTDDRIAWYKNDGNQGLSMRTITDLNDRADGASSVYAADVDGDGDMDILSASQTDNKITWYENDGNQGVTTRVITTDANGAESVYAADVDGDGDLDVLSASEDDGKIAWYENDGAADPTFTTHTITTDANGAKSVYAADVDGDGDMDVLSASYNDDKIAWYENGGGDDPTFTTHIITMDANRAMSVYAADVDGDGDMDILAAHDDIDWYENDGAADPTFTRRSLPVSGFYGYSVYAADVDGDGDMDVLAVTSLSTTDRISWLENDGAADPTFTTHTITTGANGAKSVYATDVDGDGDMDILSASSNDDKIAWYKNDGAADPTFTTHIITTDADVAKSVYAADIDGDGDMDVLSASYIDDKIAWYENDGGDDPTFTTHITTPADGAYRVYAADVDGDGDLDVLSASYNDDKIAWYENGGGDDPTFTTHIITMDAKEARAVHAADVDGDGDMDVLSASTNDDKIAWYENDGNQTFTTHVITNNADGARAVYAADVDGDGDMDVLSASFGDDTIAWYKNDGNQTFSTHVITNVADGAIDVHTADVDGDGDMDVLSASTNDDKIAWYENNGDSNPTFTKRVITTAANGAYSVYAADVDGDGDMDVLSASTNDDKIAWYENGGGDDPTFTTRVITNVADYARSVYAADVDGDGDLDILSASWNDDKIAWYEITPALDIGAVERKHVDPPVLSRSVALQPGDIISNTHFGNVALPGRISGIQYFDANGNGNQQADEPGIEDWQMFLDTNSNDSYDQGEPTTTTDLLGHYEFENLNPMQNYLVGAVPRDGWQQISPPAFHTVSVTAGSNTHHDFGSNHQPATLEGQVYKDLDNDGIHDLNEPGRSDSWTVYLDLDQSASKTDGDTVVTTGTDGYYRFDNLAPYQSYTVYHQTEVDSWFYIQTAPTALHADSRANTLVEAYANDPLAGQLTDLSPIDGSQDFYFTGLDDHGRGFNSQELFFYDGETDQLTIVGPVNDPHGLVTDQDSVYWIDYDPGGQPTIMRRLAGELGNEVVWIWNDTDTDTQLTRPIDMVLISSDEQNTRLAVLDAEAGRVWNVLVTPTGNTITSLGTARYATGTDHHHPSYLAYDQGTLYILDTGLDGREDTPARISSLPIDGGSWTTLYEESLRPGLIWSGVGDARGITVGDNTLYYSRDQWVYQLPTTGAVPAQVVSDPRFGNLGNLSFSDGALHVLDKTDRQQAASWQITLDSPITVTTTNRGWTVTPEAGAIVSGLDFAELKDGEGVGHNKTYYVTGRVYRDSNGNAQLDEGENGLAGITVYLDLNNNGRQDDHEPVTTTLADIEVTPDANEAGQYSFLDLAEGVYSVTVVPPASLQQIGPLETTFTTSTVPVSDGPRTSASHDFNGDGHPDLVVGSGKSNTVAVLLNQGDGTFADPVSYTTGPGPSDIAVGDINLDGIADLAVTNINVSLVSVLTGNGDGTFNTATQHAVGSSPTGVVIGNFNADNRPDLVVSNDVPGNDVPGTISVLLAKAEGGFHARKDYPAGNGPQGLVQGDFNGDGDLDLAIPAIDDNEVWILANNGEGVFPETDSLKYPVGNLPFAISVGNVDGDENGRLDLVVANVGSTDLSLLKGNGNGTFQTAVPIPIGNSGSTGTVLVDVDKDGDLDIAATSFDAKNVAILINEGGATFQTPVSYGVGQFFYALPFDVIADDLDNDGNVDFIVANSSENRLTILGNQLSPGPRIVTASGASTTISDQDIRLHSHLAPTIAPLDDIEVNENSGAAAVSLRGLTAGLGETQPMKVEASIVDGTLVSQLAVDYTSPASLGTLTIQPAVGKLGSSLVTVTVTDGGPDGNLATTADNMYTTESFNYTLLEVNDPPTIASIPDPADIDEDAAEQTINFTGVTAGIGETQHLAVTATSNNTALIPDPTVTYTDGQATGSLTFTPVADASGTAVVTVTVTDGGDDNDLGTAGDNLTAVTTVTITVTGVNDAPTLATITDPAAIDEDAAQQTVSFSGITAGGGEIQHLAVSATSNNPGLIPNPTVTYTDGQDTGSLKYTPLADAFGTAVVTVTVTDGGDDNNLATTADNLTTSRQFTVNVTGGNDIPTLATVSNPAAIDEDAAQQTINFTGVTAGIGETQHLAVTATSNNTALIPDPTVTYTDGQATGSLTFTPVADASGTAVITVTVTDGGDDNKLGTTGDNLTTSRQFTVNVTGVNDTPTVATITAPAAIDEDAAQQTVSFSGATAGGGETQHLAVSATSDNLDLIPVPTVTYTDGQATGSLTYTPVANASGSAVITVTVTDGGDDNKLETTGDNLTTTEQFTVNVNPLNDPPTLDSISNQSITDLAPEQTIDLSGITSGPGETQHLAVTASSSNINLVPDPTIIYTDGATVGSLKYKPTVGVSGSATITVIATDAGLDNSLETTAGNFSIEQTFTITVSLGNALPTLAGINTTTIDEDAPLQTINLASISPGGDEQQPLSIIATSSNTELVPHPSVSYTSGETTGSISFQGVADGFGSTEITISVTDGGPDQNLETAADNASFQQSFTLNITSVNDKPLASDATFEPAQDITISVDAAQGLLAIGSDVEDNLLSFTIVAGTDHGVLTTSADGSFTYQPNQGFNRTDSFTYRLNDGQAEHNLSDLAQVDFHIDTQRAWYNCLKPLDVNDDTITTPLDVLWIINNLNANGSGTLVNARPKPLTAPFYDVNKDGVATPLDALIIINALNQGAAEGEGARPGSYYDAPLSTAPVRSAASTIQSTTPAATQLLPQDDAFRSQLAAEELAELVPADVDQDEETWRDALDQLLAEDLDLDPLAGFDF